MTLIDRLLTLARTWAEASNRSLARLGTIVANDGKFFDRVERSRGCTTETFERFLAFFRDPAQWPGGTIPPEAAAQLDELKTIGAAADLSPGKSPDSTVNEAQWPLPGAVA